MGRSFVLKRPDGALAGYLMVQRDSMRLRASGIPAAGGELTLTDEHGRESRRRLCATEKEQALHGTGGEVVSAYALGGGRVLLATDAGALLAARRALAKQQAEQEDAGGRRTGRRPQPETAPLPGDARKAHEQLALDAAAELPRKCAGGAERRWADALAMRRWPPPPCVMGARYAGGRWTAATPAGKDMPCEPPRCGGT